MFSNICSHLSPQSINISATGVAPTCEFTRLPFNNGCRKFKNSSAAMSSNSLTFRTHFKTISQLVQKLELGPHTNIHTRTHAHTRTHMHTHTRAHTQAQAHKHTHARTHTQAHAHTRAYRHTHTHRHKHSLIIKACFYPSKKKTS